MTAESWEGQTAGVESSRIHEMMMSQLLAHVVRKDQMTIEEPVMAAVHAVETDIQMPFTKCPANINCCRPNHYARDCQYRSAETFTSCSQKAHRET